MQAFVQMQTEPAARFKARYAAVHVWIVMTAYFAVSGFVALVVTGESTQSLSQMFFSGAGARELVSGGLTSEHDAIGT